MKRDVWISRGLPILVLNLRGSSIVASMKDIYVQFTYCEIRGGSIHPAHVNAVEVASFRQTIAQRGAEGSSFLFTKDIDSSSAGLLAACIAGRPIRHIEVHFYRRDGEIQASHPAYTLELKDAVVSSIAQDVDCRSTEVFSLAWTETKWHFDTR